MAVTCPLSPRGPFVYHKSTVEKETWERAVERFAGSRTMRHRPTLRQLFLYLARKTLDGQAAELKEYVIGLEAFQKPPDYDPQKDASIRVQISRLRQCLSQYYEEECPGDPIRLEIPKGQFEVTFREVGAAVAPQPAPEWRWRGLSWASALLPGAVIVAIIGVALSWRAEPGQHKHPALAPELAPIWGPYVDTNRAVLVVLGTPLFTKYTTAETGVFFRDPRLNDWGQAAASPDISKIGAAVGGTHTTPSHIYTGVGEAIGAFQLGRLLAHSPQEVLLRRGHALSWDDFKDRNVIVLGAPKHNLHLNHLPVE